MIINAILVLFALWLLGAIVAVLGDAFGGSGIPRCPIHEVPPRPIRKARQ
jgi:hypothetical protein